MLQHSRQIDDTVSGHPLKNYAKMSKQKHLSHDSFQTEFVHIACRKHSKQIVYDTKRKSKIYTAFRVFFK